MQELLGNMRIEAAGLLDSAAGLLGELDVLPLAMVLPLLVLMLIGCAIRAAAGE